LAWVKGEEKKKKGKKEEELWHMPCCKIGLEFGKCALHNNIKFRARKAYWYITYMNGGLQEHGI